MLNKLMSILMYPLAHVSWPEISTRDVQAGLVLSALVVLFCLELRFAHRRESKKALRQSYLTNMASFVFNDTMMSLLSMSSLLLLAERIGGSGMTTLIPNGGARFAVTLLILDLSLYAWHWACHRFEALWMFHKVHHSDLCMNVSTAFRLHFAELILTTLIKAVLVILMAVDVLTLLACESTITLFVLFHHANVRFAGERGLGRLTIVPYLHRLHHSAKRSEHDSNYGAVFSVWDRLFGTLRESEPAALGLRHVAGQNFLELLRFGLTPVMPLPGPEPSRQMIAEAAYFKAEKRGFAPGFDRLDWIEAERDILRRAD